MESDYRYYQRRAAAERLAAQRAVTPQARDRRMNLARVYDMKASNCLEVEPLPLLATA
ncbi:MAG: hypothetical protein V4530_15065 [Pseudomonadota bacterium]